MLSKSKIFWCAATLMGGAVVFSSAALAETYRMRMHVNQPASEKSYHYIYATQFSERVAKYTDNAVKVTIFPGAQLGGDPAVFQQLQLGAVQSGIFAFPNLVEFYKPFNVFSLPFLFGDFDSAVTAFQGPTAQRLYDGFEKQVGVKVLGVLPKEVDGLLVAGRCLSASREAVGSARMGAQCMAYGHAAGVAAAIAAREGVNLREMNIQALRTELLNQRAIL